MPVSLVFSANTVIRLKPGPRLSYAITYSLSITATRVRMLARYVTLRIIRNTHATAAMTTNRSLSQKATSKQTSGSKAWQIVSNAMRMGILKSRTELLFRQ